MKNLRKISPLLVLFVVIIFISSFSSFKPQICSNCQNNDELEKLIQKINDKARKKNGYLVQQEYFSEENSSNSERRIIWQGSYSYCNGECFAIVTVTANCLFGYCWGYGYSQVGNEECPCGDL